LPPPNNTIVAFIFTSRKEISALLSTRPSGFQLIQDLAAGGGRRQGSLWAVTSWPK
jgi:hypothetical protein